MSAPTNWQLERLIGPADQQRWLEQILQEDIPARRGRTVIITGPLGSGRAALARFGLWQSLYALPRSVELGAITGTIQFSPEKKELQQSTNALQEIAKGLMCN